VLPGDYAYRLDAVAMDGSGQANLTMVVTVKQYFDLKLTIANPHQQITLSESEISRTIEFQFLVTNQGNGQDQFSVATTPVRPEDSYLDPVLRTDNTTLGPTEVSDVGWTLIAPQNLSAGYHNFTVELHTDNLEIDYSDNAGIISILVMLPQVVDVYNVTFEGALKANPQHPARGQSIEFTAPIRNTGNKPVILKVWMNASGILTTASTFDALEPTAP